MMEDTIQYGSSDINISTIKDPEYLLLYMSFLRNFVVFRKNKFIFLIDALSCDDDLKSLLENYDIIPAIIILKNYDVEDIKILKIKTYEYLKNSDLSYEEHLLYYLMFNKYKNYKLLKRYPLLIFLDRNKIIRELILTKKLIKGENNE